MSDELLSFVINQFNALPCSPVTSKTPIATSPTWNTTSDTALKPPWSLDAKAQHLLNALESGTVLPVHRHRQTAETYMLLRGRLKVFFHDSDGRVSESFLLDPLEGQYGVHIPAGQWHSLEVLQSGSVIFEVKDGPYEPLGEGDVKA